MQVHGAWMTAATSLLGHVRGCLGKYDYERMEVEWRVGHRMASFRPGVTKESWEALQRALEGSPMFVKSYSESTERMGDTPGVKCIDNVGWMSKKRLVDVDQDAGTRHGHMWSIRASVSLEDPIKPQGIPLKYERRKQRWSYTHQCWRVDLTRVLSNLPMHLDEDQEIYEVELELADVGVLFEKRLDHVLDWGWSFVGELCDIMKPGADPTDPPQPQQWCDMQ